MLFSHKMITQDPLEEYQQHCRTCYNSKNNLQLLKSLPESWTNQNEPKTYAELLTEVCQIDLTEAVTQSDLWPQFICLTCCEKLKSAYDFIQQTHKINKYLKTLSGQLQTKTEHFIEIPELDIPLDIKMEKDNDVELAVNVGVFQYNSLERKEDAVKTDIASSVDSLLEKVEAIKSDKVDTVDNDFDDRSNFDDMEYISETTVQSMDYINKNLLKSPTNESTHQTLTCSECHKIFATVQKLNHHKRFNHVPEDKKLPCHICNMKFSRTYHLKRHLQNVHAPSTKGEIVKKDQNPKTIMDINTAMHCNQCGKIFYNSQKFSRHQRHAHVPDEKKFVCHMCGQKFGRSDHFRRHMRNLHQTDVSILKPKRQIRLKDNRFACDKCDRSYTRRCRLYKHERLMHNDE
ncbi:Zinc finger protein 184 [Lucilia cuprina]|nr:Zinc finger protein 184 [Lucilia cuprina]